MGTDGHVASKLSALTDQFAELRLPTQPRLVTDLYPVVLADGGLHLVGAEPKTLNGGSLGWMVRTIFPLLDGTRTIEALAEALPTVAMVDLRDVLSLLYMHGMLEEGCDAGTEHDRTALSDAHGPQMAFLSRYLRLTGRHASRFGAQRALGSARVAVVGAAEHRAVMASLLQPIGLGGCVELDLEMESEVDALEVALYVVIGDVDAQERCAARLRRSTTLFVDPHAWSIGPLTVFGHSACVTCVRLQQQGAPSPRPVAGDLDQHERDLWCRALFGRAVQHVIAYITGVFQSPALEHIECWDPVTGATSLRAHVLQLPNCPTCGEELPPFTVTLASGHRENRALCFHRSALLKPWHLEQPSAIQVHLSRDVSDQLRHARLVPRRVAAADSHESASSVSDSSSPSSPQAQRLAQLLTLSFGGRVRPAAEGGHHFYRNTASAGNLGSAEPYVIVTAIDGLASGVYHYDTALDTLDVLRHDDPAGLRALLAPVERAGAETCAVIVIVSAVARLCAKYEARGYVYSLLDAGIMAHRINILARSLGLEASPQLDFDDDAWCRCLGVDGVDLAPVLVVGLHAESRG
ncbi:SagB family peptide dehydrogenase [Enhygromyxa salina]|uniref:Nitroreductase family protein n=1 Tax=Enhygromyxa salina TaxID=215803 RepID=A0A2S9YT77_9BACT|nr:SagB family peptide dehydrogenase [Enhygromyxa salina]PRQ08298.1 Nitroreductase family protein [Enhygromyxa salina]